MIDIFVVLIKKKITILNSTILLLLSLLSFIYLFINVYSLRGYFTVIIILYTKKITNI